MKIFIIAYACDPNRQSEPGLGWNISQEIARRHEVTLVTREKNRAIIENYLSEHPECSHAGTNFLYHDTNGFLRKFKAWIPFGTQLYFSHWLKTATNRYYGEIKNSDIVHQLTFCPFFIKPWGAAYTDRYVWGPIGGGGGIDARFPRGFPIKGIGFKAIEWMYKFLSWIVYSPFSWRFARLRSRVAAVTFKASAFAKGFPVAERQFMAVTKETGYDGEIKPRQYTNGRHPLNVVAVGRMIPHKGFEYSIRGFAKFISAGGDGRFDIFGDGPLRKELERLTATLKMNEKIVFHGNVPNTKIHKTLDEADVFLHASFIEAAAWSILEAMIHGVPVICQNRSGMVDMVADGCGIKVSANSPKELVSSIASALSQYYENPSLVETHGKKCQVCIREDFSWRSVVDKIDEVYRQVAGV